MVIYVSLSKTLTNTQPRARRRDEEMIKINVFSFYFLLQSVGPWTGLVFFFARPILFTFACSNFGINSNKRNGTNGMIKRNEKKHILNALCDAICACVCVCDCDLHASLQLNDVFIFFLVI